MNWPFYSFNLPFFPFYSFNVDSAYHGNPKKNEARVKREEEQLLSIWCTFIGIHKTLGASVANSPCKRVGISFVCSLPISLKVIPKLFFDKKGFTGKSPNLEAGLIFY